MYRVRAVLVLLACVAVVPACGGTSNASLTSGPGPTAPSNSTPNRTMTAVIDGVQWTASAVGVQTGGALILSGTDAQGTTVGVTTSGTVGSNSVIPGGIVIGQLTTPAGTWQAAGGNGAGTVNVTSYTATGASGTFSFTLPALTGGASGVRTVANGTFSVTF